MSPRVRFIRWVFLVLSLVVPALAWAEDAAIHWGDCGAAGTSARSFACNTNSGVELIVVSYTPHPGNTGVVGLSTGISVGQYFDPLPDWWRFYPTSCRSGVPTANVAFTTSTGPCADPWSGQASVVLTHTRSGYVNMLGRMNLVVTLPVDAATPLDPNSEYYAVSVVIPHRQTVGTGSCAGCQQPVCLALDYVQIVEAADVPNGTSHFVAPSFGTSSIVWNGVASCYGMTPVRNRTWGQIKSIYR